MILTKSVSTPNEDPVKRTNFNMVKLLNLKNVIIVKEMVLLYIVLRQECLVF